MKKTEVEKTFYENNVLPKIESINQKYFDNLISDQFKLNLENNEKLLNESKLNYKNNHNEFLYFLSILSNGLTIFPLCGLFHKKANNHYKKLKENKENLENNIKNATDKKLDTHNDIKNYLLRSTKDNNYFKYIKELLDVINIKSMGFINEKLIKELKAQSLISFENNENTYLSHWSIFENNKIVINFSKQKHYMIPKEYSNSITVYDEYTDNEGNTHTESETLTAYHVEPFPVFEYSSINYFFMQSCSNLEFRLKKMYLGLFKKSKRKTTISMENEEFERSFDFEKNDEVQFRMIFTPLGQELFLNDVKNVNQNNGNLKPYYFQKYSSFLTNNCLDNFNLNRLSQSINNNFNKFTSDVNQTAKKLLENNYKTIKNYIFNKYITHLPGYLLPIMSSENHINTINRVKNDQSFNVYLLYYVFFKMFNEKIISLDTDTFYNADNLKIIDGILKYTINASTYERIPSSIVKYVYSSLKHRDYAITVNYDYYKLNQKSKDIYVGFINNEDPYYFYGKEHLFGTLNNNKTKEKLANEFKTINQLGLKLSIKKGIVAIYNDQDVDSNTCISLIKTIIKKLNN